MESGSAVAWPQGQGMEGVRGLHLIMQVNLGQDTVL